MQNEPTKTPKVKRDVPTKYAGVRQRCHHVTGKPVPGVFELIYSDSDGKQRRRKSVATTAAGAHKERQNLVSKEVRGERILSRDDETRTFKEAAEVWRSEQRTRPRTRELVGYSLDNKLYPKFANRPMWGPRGITTDNIAAFIRELEASGLSAATINKCVGVMGQVYKFAMRRYNGPSNPVVGLTRGERPTAKRREKYIFGHDDLQRLLKGATPHWRMLWVVLAYSGLRISEALGLRWCDIDFDNNLIHVRHQLSRSSSKDSTRALVDTKTANSVGIVNLLPELSFALRSYQRQAGFVKADDLLFTVGRKSASDRGHLGRDLGNAGTAFNLALKAAGLPDDGRRKPTPHDLRHTFASFLLKKTGDVAYVSKQLRKSVSDTLKTYADVWDPASSAAAAEGALSEHWDVVVGQLLVS